MTINVFISDDATDDEVQAFQEKLESWQNVQSVNFKSKEDALEEYRNMSSSADSTIAALDGENPLPRSYEVVMEDSSQVEDMANRIKEEMVGRLFQVTGYIRIACIVLVALLTFIAFIFINNTIRLSITARRREIAIMRLVGASNGFIRGPFVTEGVLQALLGALLSIGVLELVRNFLMPRVMNMVSWWQFEIPLEVYLMTYGALILVGLVIGLFGSAIAMRRYLKV